MLVEKSTVPVKTGERIKCTLEAHGHDDAGFDVASVPESLRDGSAVKDTPITFASGAKFPGDAIR